MDRKRRWLALGIGGGAALTLGALTLPLVVPVPPLQDVLPPEQLADSDSRFARVMGLRVHYKMTGHGQPVWVLLHGFGSSVFSWREVLASPALAGTKIAFDRPAFGLTERPLSWQGPNPYSPRAQADITVGLMDALEVNRAVLVGSSAGGAVALLTALTYPQRVRGLVLVDAAVLMPVGVPHWLRPVLTSPQMRRIGPLLIRRLIRGRGQDMVRMAWHHPDRVTPEVMAGYTKPLKAQDWDKALWELVAASEPLPLHTRLHEVSVPTLVITGEYDRLVAPRQAERLTAQIPGAQLVVIPDCGHLPQEECPQEFLQALQSFAHSI
jgi:pimeloyl-ACP methyl ester carboxylesterase